MVTVTQYELVPIAPCTGDGWVWRSFDALRPLTISEKGVVVGVRESYDASDQLIYTPYRFADGTLTPLSWDTPQIRVRPVGINHRDGVEMIIAVSDVGPVRWVDGARADPNRPAGAFDAFMPLALSKNGHEAGYVDRAGARFPYIHTPSGVTRVIDTRGAALGVNDAGLAVGYTEDHPGWRPAWFDAAAHVIPNAPGAGDPAPLDAAVALNDAGYCVGASPLAWTGNPTSTNHFFTTHVAMGYDTAANANTATNLSSTFYPNPFYPPLAHGPATWGWSHAWADAINASGVIVGGFVEWAYGTAIEDTREVAFVMHDAAYPMHALRLEDICLRSTAPSKAVVPIEFRIDAAVDINDSGWIVAVGRRAEAISIFAPTQWEKWAFLLKPAKKAKSVLPPLYRIWPRPFEIIDPRLDQLSPAERDHAIAQFVSLLAERADDADLRRLLREAGEAAIARARRSKKKKKR